MHEAEQASFQRSRSVQGACRCLECVAALAIWLGVSSVPVW